MRRWRRVAVVVALLVTGFAIPVALAACHHRSDIQHGPIERAP